MEPKNTDDILRKLGIEKLNPMQEEASHGILTSSDIVLLSPTGTGKTLAFLLPIVASLEHTGEVQILIIVPSRELALQIEQVARNMGSGHKINAVYGGRATAKDRIELQQKPAILIGTPGRIADHIRKGTFDADTVTTLVLDEFDKSLEVGFEEEMSEIIQALYNVNKRILTSATQGVEIPAFVGLKNAAIIDFSDEKIDQLQLKRIISPSKDKLATLVQALEHIGNVPGIIFCNFRDSIDRVSEYLEERGVSHGCFHGGLEQRDRERALIKFRNGSHQLLIATDLAARGIDVPEIEFIIHYHLPYKAEEFTHRNGRTARMNRGGTAYVLHWAKEDLPDFIRIPEVEVLKRSTFLKTSDWTTIFVSGGRKDKISKGDIAGLLYKKGGLQKDQLGTIEIKNDCAFVAVKKSVAREVITQFDNTRLKKKKVRIREV